jgi:hypothetical protein
MRFMGPEEDGIVAVSRTPRLSLISIFAAGDSPSDAASPSKHRDEEADGGGKCGYSST